ncbi:MAG: permease-like cell division protein FtsX [Candidatus Latescibacteria bacterium]|jgi:cell division transport system permease protein|nr:permease-like cell division protein FtsX [Candidatus Latescibacterota bacterium]
MGLTSAFREAVRGLRRTGTVGIVSVLTAGASLLVLGLFAHLVAGGYVLAESLRGRAEIEVYLKDSTSRRRALSIARDLEDMQGVSAAVYLDKEAAAAEFEGMFGEGLLEAVSRNPLPASIRVGLTGEAELSVRARLVADAASGYKEVEAVDTGASWLESLDRALATATWVGLLLGGVLCLACAFAVSNTAKLMVLAEREAIEVMRLVGSTGGTIRLTFLLGGALQGFLGGALAAVALWIGRGWWTSWIPGPDGSPTFSVGPWLVLLGILLGVVGSWASLGRVLSAVSRKT